MGSANSSNNSSPDHIAEHTIPGTVGIIQDEVLRHARVITEIANLTYEEFQVSLGQLNALSKRVTDREGRRLVFAVKKGTDSTVLWKGTIRIACIKLEPESNQIESYRLLNLNQFLKIFKTLQCHLTAASQSSRNELITSVCNNRPSQSHIANQLSKEYDTDSPTSDDNVSSYQDSDTDSSSKENESKEATPSKEFKQMPFDVGCAAANMKPILTASMLFEQVDSLTMCYGSAGDNLGECCICLERKSDVMLPCTHAYCLPCIEQWNASHKTCPICRETLESTDDTWVISDIPGSTEISEEICSALMKLTTDNS